MTELEIGLPHIYSGKVRDIYDAGDDRWLMVTSDRISAFDVVLSEPIPDKGRVLTAMSAFWFEELAGTVGSHLISCELDDLPPDAQHPSLAGRIMLVDRADMVPIECIVRGYLSGSGWKEYKSSGTLHGMRLPSGLRESECLPEPMFTPSTKAETGHDVNISFEDAVDIVGKETAERLREVSLEVYRRGAERALAHGIVIADTKFELGFVDGELVLADEVLTPDSSRFWPASEVSPGSPPPSFDKQPVRDYLETLEWDKTPPPPPLPDEVVQATSARYIDAYERVTGLRFSDWPGAGT